MIPTSKQEKILRRPISERETASFCRRLSPLSASGISEALLIAARHAPKHVVFAARAAREDLLAGLLLSEAFEREKFSPAALPYLRLAERCGSYENCLLLAADAMEKRIEYRRKLLGTAGYLLLLLGVLALFFIFSLLVLPAMAEALSALSLTAPALTYALIRAGEVLLHALPWLVLAAALIALLFLFVRRIPRVRIVLGAIKLLFPAERAGIAAMFALFLSQLMRGGATLSQALEGTQQLLPNARAAESVRQAAERVAAGEPLSTALKEEKVFPAFLISLLAAWEQTGSPGLMEGALPALKGEYEAARKTQAGIGRVLLFSLIAALIVLLYAAYLEPVLLLLTAVI